MANLVQSHYDDLQKISQRFQRRAQSILQTTQAITRQHARLQQSWEGKGASAFTQEMSRLVLPALNRLHQALQHAAQATRTIAQTMYTAETEAAALFRREPVGAVPGSDDGASGAAGGGNGASFDMRGGGDLTTPVSYNAGLQDYQLNGGDDNPEQESTPEPEGTAEPEDPHAVPFVSDTLPIASDSIDWEGGFGANQFSSDMYDAWIADMTALNEEIAAAEALGTPTPEQIAAWDARRKEINDDYPYENTSGLHGGLDFGAEVGTEVTAIAEGVVVNMYSNDAKPNVVVQYGEGEDAYYVVYGHVDMDSDLEVGDTIAVGDTIGTVAPQTYPHLHLAIRQDSQVYNPLYFFSDTAGAGDIFEDAPYPEGEDVLGIFSFEYSSSANYWNDPDAEALEIVE